MRHLGIVASARHAAGGSFDPLSLPWTAAWWAEGPEFTALGYANTDPVGTWPDEAGSSDFTQATANQRPLYVTSGVGGQPAVDPDGSNDFMSTASRSAVAQPHSIVIICRTSYEQANRFVVGQGGTYVRTNNNGSGGDALTLNTWGGTINSASNLWSSVSDHLIVAYFDGASTEGDLDGTTVVTGSVGTNGMDASAATLFDYASGNWAYSQPVAFIGFASGDIRTDPDWASFCSWAETHYGLTIA